MRQTLTNDFGGLHKNMNCAFPLSKGETENEDGNFFSFFIKSLSIWSKFKLEEERNQSL